MVDWLCREGREFSPVVGFFIDANPSQVSIIVTSQLLLVLGAADC